MFFHPFFEWVFVERIEKYYPADREEYSKNKNVDTANIYTRVHSNYLAYSTMRFSRMRLIFTSHG